MNSAAQVPPVCPDCGAQLAADAKICWLCRADQSKLARPPHAALSPPAAGENTFALDTIFLITTLIAVCSGIVAIAPESIVFVVLLVVPALVQTLGKTRQQLRAGHEPTAGEKIGSFFSSLVVAALIWLAAMIAFFCACWAACGAAALVRTSAGDEDSAIIAGLVFGGIAGVVVFARLFWLLWPGRRKKKTQTASPQSDPAAKPDNVD